MSARVMYWSLLVDHASGNTWAEFRTTADKQPYHHIERYHVETVLGTWRAGDVNPLPMQVVKSESKSKEYKKGRVKLASQDGILGADGQELDVSAWVDLAGLEGKRKERIPKPKGQPVKWCPRTGEWVESFPEPKKPPLRPGLRAAGWYGRCDGVLYIGPYPTQREAVKAILGADDGLPRPGAFVWEVP